MTTALDWRGCGFAELDVYALQAIHRARQAVFVVEQQCFYLDADALDARSFHLAAWGAEHDGPLAYARIVEPGARYPEPSIGRVLTVPAARGRGLGRELVTRAVGQCVSAFPGRGIRINAQSHLRRFYGTFGFAAVGGPYLEDNIEHLEMLRPG